jgi:hypothetical protein
MSGKRQHFIPRFLQEGFAAQLTTNGVFTWAYRKGEPPFKANITNVGVEGHFYTDASDTRADDLITNAEEVFSTLVKTLRTLAPTPVSDPAIPKLIAHLEARTRHVRQGFLLAGEYFSSRLIDFIGDEKSFLSYVERTLQNDPSILQTALASELANWAFPKRWSR